MLLVKTTFDYAEERLRLEAITLEPTYIFELISALSSIQGKKL